MSTWWPWAIAALYLVTRLLTMPGATAPAASLASAVFGTVVIFCALVGARAVARSVAAWRAGGGDRSGQ